MLTVRQLGKTYGKKKVLEEIDIEVADGAMLAILGPSGSGKTTLLRLIMGLEAPDTGQITLKGDLLSDSGKVVVLPAMRSTSMVFQNLILFPHLNVRENIALALKAKSALDRTRRLDELLELLGITALQRSPISTLSGGELQRVALARALVNRPKLLLLDEPFSNLDTSFKRSIFAEFRQILLQAKTTALFVTHDHEEAFFFSDSIVVIKAGKIIQQAPAKALYKNPVNPWVAAFVGGVNCFTSAQIAIDFGYFLPDTTYLIRPEALRIDHRSQLATNAEVVGVIFFGFYQELILKLTSGLEVRVKHFDGHDLAVGEKVRLNFNQP